MRCSWSAQWQEVSPSWTVRFGKKKANNYFIFCIYIKPTIFNYLAWKQLHDPLESNLSNTDKPNNKAAPPSRTQGLALGVTGLLECGLGIKEDLGVPKNWPGFFSLHKAEDTNQPGGLKKKKKVVSGCFFLEMLRTWVQNGCRRNSPLHFQWY